MNKKGKNKYLCTLILIEYIDIIGVLYTTPRFPVSITLVDRQRIVDVQIVGPV